MLGLEGLLGTVEDNAREGALLLLDIESSARPLFNALTMKL